ncbi:MAG: acyl-CoA/acyl-ACP dehydrogenase [Dehalococcoidia bacterium]|nr:acyl-CoA/acyl-ACP dehydrogenase [Dehalococcoidia bacterium]
MDQPTDRTRWMQVIEEIGPGFAEGVEERDRDDTFIADHYTTFRDRGLLSAMIPESLGGGGATHSTVAAALRRLAWYDPSAALALSMHQHLIAAQVFNHLQGKPAPVLSRVANDQVVLVSTGARDWLDSNGEVRRVDGGYVVSARKAFASGSPAGDIAVTSAPYLDSEVGWQVLHFAVPFATAGVSLADDWYTHGMRATGSRTIVFDEVFVPEGAITLRRPSEEWGPWHVVLAVALPLIAGVYVGIAERAAEVARELCASRGRTSTTVQWSVGEMQSALVVARACHDRMVALTNDLDFTPSIDLSDEALVLKTQTVESARLVVERAVEAVGGVGFYRSAGLERLLRDVRAGDYHPFPAKEQRLLTGRRALGLPPIEPHVAATPSEVLAPAPA